MGAPEGMCIVSVLYEVSDMLCIRSYGPVGGKDGLCIVSVLYEVNDMLCIRSYGPVGEKTMSPAYKGGGGWGGGTGCGRED